MLKISREHINRAIADSEWDLGNKILYDMCKKYPSHNEPQEIIGKIWLIGRAYAAAIERRKEVGNGHFDGDDFYIKRVVPKILKGKIDSWLKPLENEHEISYDNLQTVLSVHLKITNLFYDISGLKKRSLASKYLHFHFPNLFFIYDSRVVMAVSKLSYITGRLARPIHEHSDKEYQKFCKKCLIITEYVKNTYSVHLSPRYLDNLLLEVGKQK